MAKKKQKEEEGINPEDLIDENLLHAFGQNFAPAASPLDATEVWYDYNLREYFNCLATQFYGCSDLLGAYKMRLSEMGFMQRVSSDGRPCYYLKYSV